MKIDLNFKSIIYIILEILNLPIRYDYYDFSILLPAKHKLPLYQIKYPQYDRVLPIITSFLEDNATIIDIGANVGDTLAAMIYGNSKAKYICIEADDNYFKLLNKNIKNIRSELKNIDVKTISALVGKQINNVTLIGKNGTKHSVSNLGGKLISTSLDQIINECKICNIRMIKIDVDGYDYDVINSAMDTLIKFKPIIYFEVQIDHQFQKDGYYDVIKKLFDIEYCDWIIFDNFGEIIIRTSTIDNVYQLMEYIWLQNVNKSNRTIYYLDVLAVQKSNIDLADKIVNKYQV